MLRLLFLICAISFSGCSTLDSLCGNMILEEIPSPDKKLKAVLFARDCGATTSESMQVSILDADENLDDNSVGNVFITDYETISLKWLSVSALEITIPPKAQTFKQQRQLGDISIVYKQQR